MLNNGLFQSQADLRYNGPNSAIPSASAASTGPLSLNFALKKVVRPVALHSSMAPDIELDFSQAVASQLNQTRGISYTLPLDGTLETTGTASEQVIQTLVTPSAPWFGVSAGVTFGGGATAQDRMQVGIYKDTSDCIMAQIDNKANQVKVRALFAGVDHSSVAATYTPTNVQRMGLSVTGNIAAVWVYNGKIWIEIHRVDLSAYIDLHETDLSSWYYTMWSYIDVANPQYFSDFKAGPFGSTGWRDINLVTYEDGSPYIDSGKMFVTVSIGAPGSLSNSNSICAAHWGVFTFDPATFTFQQTGRLISKRNGGTFGDHAGKLVYDRNANVWRVLVSTWGDIYLNGGSGCDISYQSLDISPLYGTLFLSNLVSLTLKGTDVNCYDPELFYHNGLWHLVYSRATSAPSCYHLSASTIAGLATATTTQLGAGLVAEGPKIRSIGGTPYIVLGGQTAMAVYDMQNNSVGSLALTFLAAMVSKQPHPNIIPIPLGEGTRYSVITFNQVPYNDGAANNNFSHGDVIIYGSQTVPGREYPYPL